MVTKEFVEKFERQILADGKTSLNFLEEKLREYFVTFAMPKFSPFFEEFKNKIQRLIEAGICPEKLAIGTFPVSFKQDKIDIEVPALVLNMDDLEIGFLVCLVPLALSVIAFIGEFVAFLMKTLAMKTRDLLILLNLIRVFSNLKIN